MEQQKCTSCRCFKAKEEFMKRGRPIKTCFGCRVKSKVQKSTEVPDKILRNTDYHDLLVHQRRLRAVQRQYWKQADYAVHVFRLKQNFAEIHDYLVATDYVGHFF